MAARADNGPRCVSVLPSFDMLLDMAIPSTLDISAFIRGFDMIRSGNGSPKGDAELSGWSFGDRLFKSIRTPWYAGDPYDPSAVRSQLEAVIRGDVTILPSPAEMKLQIDNLLREETASLPAAVVEQVRQEAYRNAEVAESDRQAKQEFDRDIAPYVLEKL